MPAERFDFPNADGQKLAALLDTPIGTPRAYALFAHCFTCGKDVHAARRIAESLTALGIAVLRFDFTGLGSSEGEFANTTFSSNIADLVAAAGARQFRVRRAFLDDVAEQNLTARIGNLRKALLIFHSPIDDVVGIENASHI